MIVRRDHVAGGAFVVGGIVVLAVSGDLPFGSLASPGAGMLPTLVVGFMVAFGAVLFLRAAASPPLGEIDWSDLPHALRVGLVAAVAVALYTVVGFLVTVPLLLFTLAFAVERKPILQAALFSIGVTALTYGLFAWFLKTPLPPVPRDLPELRMRLGV
jgi:Tripartite tricarboxylate transporter TctB family